MLFNRRQYKTLRKKLRNTATRAEWKLWLYLRKSQFHGLKFRRQQGIGRFIVDFYCPALHLAIEIDGESHFEPAAIEYDTERTAWLNAHEIQVIRFRNNEVMKDIEGVLDRLESIVKTTLRSSLD